MKYREDLDPEQLDQLAREFWQDDLAKFFLKQKEPTYTEYRMFQAGYQEALGDSLSEARRSQEQLEVERQSNGILRATLKQTKELLQDTLAFIEAMEEQTK
jgi:hypothetical protein